MDDGFLEAAGRRMTARHWPGIYTSSQVTHGRGWNVSCVRYRGALQNAVSYVLVQ